VGLRERKKVETWRDIRAAAVRLFAEQGYEATTIEQVATAANVSRTTFFNYFANKEAVVFDHDAAEREQWREVMRARPAGEPLWESLTVIITQFNATLRERMLLQRRLGTESPTVRRLSQNLSEDFRGDVRDWVSARVGAGDMTAALMANLALTASNTAYRTWPAHESFDDFLRRVADCLRLAKPAAAG
jgi:AcrR family transcriptional regulator